MSKKTTTPSVRAEDHIVVFQESAIRRVWQQEEWWFSVVDVCAVLTDSADAGAYWRKLKQRLATEGSEVVTFCHGLKLEAPDGKQRITDCANTEGLFRVIQSIPSPKAEPIKRWLAQVGYERVKEIEDPRNWPAAVPASSTKPRATPMTGSKSACAPSPSGAR